MGKIGVQIKNQTSIGESKMQFLTNWIEHYGYVILFLSLMLELIALPIPGEFLMGYAGVLVFQGKFSWILSIIISGIGSCTGMTISYWIGYKLGVPFFHKHGHRIHLGPDRLTDALISL